MANNFFSIDAGTQGKPLLLFAHMNGEKAMCAFLGVNLLFVTTVCTHEGACPANGGSIVQDHQVDP